MYGALTVANLKLSKTNLPKGSAYMMVLKHSPVVIQQRGVGAGHDVEVVSGAGVFIVVHHRRHQRREDLQVWQPVLWGKDIIKFEFL